MNEKIQEVCNYGTITFEQTETEYSVIYEPSKFDNLVNHMKSTIMIVRDTPDLALSALYQYIKNEKHWSEYSESFFTNKLDKI